MSAKSFNGNNNLLLKIGEKLYLNSMTADVNLVVTIGDDHSVYVPAHKIILSAASPVFELMFNGPMKNELDVQMADTSLDALTEFLQFFYGSNVILTLENIFTVTNLCNRYQVADGLALCEKALQKMLTINNMSKGYELALRLELGKVVKFCGQKIKQNPEGVMKSTEFLECTQETLGEILKLVLPKCSSSVVVNACMAWAKTKCERKNVEATATNMKDEFGS
ncbi:BTB/POZ domain-containing protein 2-like, partial [Contarinia nasturtii]|uniref:BTB/POZ domain-containing protein 2-like n=1 Tax=Contarinia nasturtii TaxID=265458 RepID=UPI0012D463F1